MRARAPERVPSLDDLDPTDEEVSSGPRLHVIVSAHAARQLEDLGHPAGQVLDYLRQMSHQEISWSAERMPSQHGREVFMLWAGSVRVLFDIEEDDLTVQGFGLRPRW